LSGRADTGWAVPDKTIVAGALRDASVPLVIIAIDADALPERVAVGVGEAGQSALQTRRVEGVSRQTGAVALGVDVAVAGAGEAEVVDAAVGRGADAYSIADYKVGATLDGGLLHALIVDVGESVPRETLALAVHDYCVHSTGVVAYSSD
jgi:hypothetical protein